MKNKHTPGPWAVSMPGGQTAFNGRRVTITANGNMIADCDWNSPEENRCNAQLIAAAPDLRVACVTAEAHIRLAIGDSPGGNWGLLLTQLQQALAKATL